MYERLHSFSRSINPSQISTFIIFPVQSLIFYTSVITLLNQPHRTVFIPIFTISLILMILFAIWTGQIDPTDQVTKAYFINRKHWDRFLIVNKLTQSKVIVNCEKCRAKKQIYNAHCIICQRCIQYQDHHCSFLNTCIGQKNYKHFFITLTLAFINLLIFIISFSFGIFHLQQTQQSSLNTPGAIVSIIGVIIAIIAQIPITMLVLIHIYLNWKNLTTREWIHKGKVLPRTNSIKIQYFNLENLHSQSNSSQTPNQTQNVISLQVRSTEMLPNCPQKSRCQNLLINNNENDEIVESKIDSSNRSSNRIQISSKTSQLSVTSKLSFQESYSNQSINQNQQNEGINQLPIKLYDQEGKQNDLAQNKFNSEKFIYHSSHFQEEPEIVSKKIQQNEQNPRNQQHNLDENHLIQSESESKSPFLTTKALKLRNLIVKNALFSSLIGVNAENTQIKHQKSSSNQGDVQRMQKLFRNHSVSTIPKISQSAFQDKVFHNKKRIKTLELDPKDIELEVQNKNQRKLTKFKVNTMGLASKKNSHQRGTEQSSQQNRNQ